MVDYLGLCAAHRFGNHAMSHRIPALKAHHLAGALVIPLVHHSGSPNPPTSLSWWHFVMVVMLNSTNNCMLKTSKHHDFHLKPSINHQLFTIAPWSLFPPQYKGWLKSSSNLHPTVTVKGRWHLSGAFSASIPGHGGTASVGKLRGGREMDGMGEDLRTWEPQVSTGFWPIFWEISTDFEKQKADIHRCWFCW